MTFVIRCLKNVCKFARIPRTSLKIGNKMQVLNSKLIPFKAQKCYYICLTRRLSFTTLQMVIPTTLLRRCLTLFQRYSTLFTSMLEATTLFWRCPTLQSRTFQHWFNIAPRCDFRSTLEREQGAYGIYCMPLESFAVVCRAGVKPGKQTKVLGKSVWKSS